ncbi:MAG TPA: V-type ATPase subunit, partial [Chromatiaceae bacterium]|nr:V-type ATPase subunit [Chromatiaceae bacterium]
RRLIGALLDRIDILWLLRFRFAYQLSSSETFFQLVPSMRRLNRERLLALVNLDSFIAVLAALPPPFNSLLAESHDHMDVQRRLNAYVRAEALSVIHKGQTGVARALAYLILREQDLMALFSLIQGRLLELPAQVIKVAIETSGARCHPSQRQAA